jgi:hypothetical protein
MSWLPRAPQPYRLSRFAIEINESSLSWFSIMTVYVLRPKERANEIGLSQFGLKEGSQYVSKKSQSEEEKMGTIYSKLSSQKLSYPALVFDRYANVEKPTFVLNDCVLL